jgi:hypothetical protein
VRIIQKTTHCRELYLKQRKGNGMRKNCLKSLRKSYHPTLMVSLRKEQAWLLNMSKYFEIYNYPGKLKAILVVYQLNGKYSIWWKETKTINNIRSSELNWKIFKKYFKQKLHNYSSQAEGRIVIYQLKGKASMWWDQYVQVQHIDEKKVTWREFKRYFQRKYLTKRYYDKKMKEFFELKLGSMTIDEYERRFLELLKYVSFIKDEQS